MAGGRPGAVVRECQGGWLIVWAFRQPYREPEGAPLPWRALDANTATHEGRQTLANGSPESRPTHFGRVVCIKAAWAVEGCSCMALIFSTGIEDRKMKPF